MKYEHMTFREIVQIAEPETELERALIQKFEEALEDEAEEIAQQFKDTSNYEAQRRIGYLEGLLLAADIKFDAEWLDER